MGKALTLAQKNDKHTGFNNIGAEMSASVYCTLNSAKKHVASKRGAISKVMTAMYCMMASMMLMSAVGYADALDDIKTKLTESLGDLFTMLQSVAVPLCGVGFVVCLVAMAFSVFTGNTKNIGVWKNSMIVLAVVLIVTFLVPTLVEWAGTFGKDVNADKTLSDVQSSLGV